MDSLTQIVLGAAVGEAVLGKKVGNKAMLWGAIAGTIPDLDVLARSFTDTITATEMHRGFSHSIVFSLLMAPLLGWLVSKIHKRLGVSWQDWSKLFFWGLFTHPLLDAFTTWGTQLFWPFDLRLAFNSIFVVDPLYTLPFLICVIVAAVYNFKGRKVEAFREKAKRINKLGLYLSTAYLLLTVAIKFFAHQQLANVLEKQGIVYTQMSTRPSPMNTILWNANVDTKEAYLIGDFSFFDSQEPSFRSYPKDRELSKSIDQTPEVQRLINIAEGWYITQKTGEQWHFNDLRFGLIPIDPANPQFVFRYSLNEEEGGITVSEDRPNTENIGTVLNTLWQRLKGN